MGIDRDQAANFVGVTIAALRAEIAEAGRRAERLGAAAAQFESARARARETLEASAARREAREERRWRLETGDGA